MNFKIDSFINGLSLQPRNFEQKKLLVDQPDINNLIILLILFFIALISLKKNKTGFLDVEQTNQLKGIAIILIIVGHLWVHVSELKPYLILGGDGVSLFLILSGYGLTLSHINNPCTFKCFITKRFNKIYYAYWVATVFIMLMDYAYLDRIYSFQDIVMTFIGININCATQHIDYVRWYITFLLFWYFVFYVSTKLQSKRDAVIFLYSVSLILFPINYYYLHFGWYQIFSFPVGCFIAYYFDVIQNVLKRYCSISISVTVIFAGLVAFVLFKCYFFEILIETIPFLILLFIRESISILLSLSILVVMYHLTNFSLISSFLSLIGIISYELFLFHGPLLIKYNFVLNNDNFISSFCVYLIVVVLTSIAFHRFIKLISWSKTR